MIITDLVVDSFNYKNRIARDSDGHAHPGPERDATQTLLRIKTDEGIEGYSFGANAESIQNIVKPMLV